MVSLQDTRIGLMLLWERLMKIINGERLDYKIPNVNCAGCKHKVGHVCAYYHAVLQSNSYRPTDCEAWEHKETREGL